MAKYTERTENGCKNVQFEKEQTLIEGRQPYHSKSQSIHKMHSQLSVCFLHAFALLREASRFRVYAPFGSDTTTSLYSIRKALWRPQNRRFHPNNGRSNSAAAADQKQPYRWQRAHRTVAAAIELNRNNMAEPLLKIPSVAASNVKLIIKLHSRANAFAMATQEARSKWAMCAQANQTTIIIMVVSGCGRTPSKPHTQHTHTHTGNHVFVFINMVAWCVFRNNLVLSDGEQHKQPHNKNGMSSRCIPILVMGALDGSDNYDAGVEQDKEKTKAKKKRFMWTNTLN